MDNRFYVDDVPLARSMDEWPPEIRLDEDGNPKAEKVRSAPMFPTGEMIRRMRTSRGVSQRELASRIGRTQSAIAYYERGDSVQFDIMASIARALGYEIVIRKKKTK